MVKGESHQKENKLLSASESSDTEACMGHFNKTDQQQFMHKSQVFRVPKDILMQAIK